MATNTPTPAAELELDRLGRRLGELIQVCERLQEENRSLREERERLLRERDSLRDRNLQARTRVEAMVERLRGMERSV